MLHAMIATTILVLASVLIHDEAMRLTDRFLAALPVPPRARVIGVVRGRRRGDGELRRDA